MPFEIRHSGSKYTVINSDTGKVHGTHPTRDAAAAQVRAMYANGADKDLSGGRHMLGGGIVEYAQGGKHFISKAIKHPGALHKSLGVPAGKKIPEAKVEAATHSSDPKLAARARFAEILKGMRAKRRGK